MIAHPHTLPNGPCPGARTFGITVRNCVRCGVLLDNGDTRMGTIHGPALPTSRFFRTQTYDLWPRIPTAYYGPYINDSGLRVVARPGGMVGAPNPADL